MWIVQTTRSHPHILLDYLYNKYIHSLITDRLAVPLQSHVPLSMNEYIYCRDNPTEYADANGLFVLSTLAIIGVGAAVGALTSAGVNAVSQGIKIAKGEQEEFQWGSLAGSAVEGAVVGGVAAIPGLGTVAAALTVTAGGVGAAANSAISQGIDEGKVDG